MIKSIFNWIPQRPKKKFLLKLRTKQIESYFLLFNVNFDDIFYERTWSEKFLQDNVKCHDNDKWDYLSARYELSPEFCQYNIDWLNFYDLVYLQTLPKEFYLRNIDKFNWLPPNSLTEQNIYDIIYRMR